MTAAWRGRLSSAVLERRVGRGIHRRLHELYREQRLRAGLSLLQMPWLHTPRISLHGNFTTLPESRFLKNALHSAMTDASCPPEYVRRIDGMSGQRYRTLINSLVRQHPHARYLEVGSWMGSTAVSAMHDNALDILCIDNWSEFGGPKTAFLENIERARAQSPSARFRFIESDFRLVDYGSLGRFNIYLFDGPHTEEDQYDAIMMVRPALERRVMIMVDDWNWASVRLGTLRALRDARFKVESAVEIRTARGTAPPPALGKTSDWHNGYLLSVCTGP